MKVPVLRNSLTRFQKPLGKYAVCCLVTALFIWSKSTPLLAEGSKDFVNYPGVRMFLDTRDPQQLKVYARVGETINVGSSHVGIQGGFIVVINPVGDTVAVFDNTGTSTGLAIINNNIQEANGPIGGPNGYVPGTVVVPSGGAGIWTVIFDYPSYVQTPFANIANNAPWTRAVNQPNTRRVVLAWDITVTSGGAGNAGGIPHEGRVYSNEHISLINGNGQSTSPVFYVLTDDGYLYQVNMMMADPFRFPISSNSLGITRGNGSPTYKSMNESAFTRDDSPASWDPNEFYLYEPQAEDYNELINNKIFFNLPDTLMPQLATTTDVFRDNTHVTWLYNDLQTLEVLDQYILGANPMGAPCAPGIIEFGKGAYFIFETNLGGSVVLYLDLNNDGDYDDPEDVELMGTLGNGVDSILWDGNDGLGNPIAVQDSFQFNYSGTIRFGELHIALTDVENNPGGVTFNWLNAPAGFPTDQFYYDHSEINGPVSGGGTPGNALPTNVPYTYGNNAGNNRYIDQWFFIEQGLDTQDVVVNVVIECDCLESSPVLQASLEDTICAGDDLILEATNTFAGTGDLTYVWTGPNNFTFTETIGESETSTATINNATLLNAGIYTVIATNDNGCADTIDINVTVNPTPQVLTLTGGGSFCAGELVTFIATNLTPGIDSLSYTLTGPDTDATGIVVGNTVTIVLGPLTTADNGTYTLVLTSEDGCSSAPVSADVMVNLTPVLQEVSGSGSYCEGENVTLIVENTAPISGLMSCTVTGPNGFFSQAVINGDDDLVINLTNVDETLEGAYTFTCTFNGCVSNTVTLNVDVQRTPEINAIVPEDDFCVGANVNFNAENVTPNTGPLTYYWIGPNGDTLFTGTNAPPLGPFPFTLQNLQPQDTGIYTLILVTGSGCESVPQTTHIGILPTPEICMLTGGGDACVGQTVTLSAFNCNTGIGSINYVWQDPQGNDIGSGTVNNDGPFEVVLDDVQIDDSGVYTLTLTSTVSGCTDVVSVTVTVLQGLNVVDITPDSSYCEGTDVTLTATTTVNTGEVTYTWTGPNGFIFTETVNAPGPLSVIITSISVMDTGTYTLNVTSDAGCMAGPFDVYVGLNPTFTITDISGGGSYCLENADSILLMGTGAGTADSVVCVWIGPNGDTLATDTGSASDPFNILVTTQIEGDYTLVCTTIEGCSDSESVSVSIIDNPIADILTIDTFLCELDTFVLCGQNLNPNVGVFDYVWTTPNGIIITGQGNGTGIFCDELLPMATFGSGLYTLVISYQGCVSVDSVNIFLNPNPVISQITGGGTYCEGESVVLQFWNTNPAVDSFFHTCVIGNTTITGIASTMDTITIVVTEPGFVCCSIESLDGCVSSLACAEVIFEPSPDIEVTSNAPVCANEDLLLNGTNVAACTGDVTYTWTGPGGFIFTSTAPCNGPFPATVTNPEPGEYCLVVDNGSCSDTACVTVEIVDIPFVEGGIVSGGGDFCAGSDAQLAATIVNPSGGDLNYVWTLNGNPVTSGTAPSGTVVTLDLTDLNAGNAGTYCIELTCVTTGCESDGPDCATITVSQSVEDLEATGGGDYCEGDDVMLNGSSTQGPGNVTYTWTGPGFNFSDTAPNGGPYPATVAGIDINQSGTYTLVVETATGCLDSASVEVTVNPEPLITNVSGGGSYCEGETTTITFTIDPNGAASVDWTLTCPDADTSGTVTTVTTISIDILVTGASAGTCTITAVSDAGCEAEAASQTITVTEVETPTLSVDPGELCPGETLTLTATSQGGTSVTYEWFRNDVSLGTSTSPTFVVDPGVPGEYTVLVSVDGCGSNLSAPVTVTGTNAPDAQDDSVTGDAGEPINGNVLGNDSPQTGITITVVSGPANGTVTLNEDGSFTYTSNVGFNGEEDEFVYEICLTDCPDACDEATVTITINQTDCVFPNVITPDGDGINDVFDVQCEPQTTSRLRVFNRWGDEIVTFQPYLNDWDGTYGSDKKEVPASTYFFLYEEDIEAGDEPKAGYIKVVR